MQIARLLASAVVGRQLHGADTSATLTLHLTRCTNMYSGKGLGQRLITRGYPRRDGSNRAERTPGARGIDERQGDANDGGHHDNGPKYATYPTPHGQAAFAPGNGQCQLDAKHREDEEHHEQAEAEGAHKLRYRLVG